ncbi:MAG: fibronectin type III domain-containing protein [Thermoplasmata archaeon]|nr:fibronectin type III domain-containing protein [Thermoplasmata archaeon]
MSRVGTLTTVSILTLASFLVLVDFTSEDVEAQNWNLEIVDPERVTGWFPSLALDSSELPHISYYQRASKDLRYTKWNGTGWEITTIDSIGYVGLWTSLALDSNDRPHISYYNETAGDLKYAVWGGSDWVVQDVDTPGTVGLCTSMALDNNDRAHISYFDDGAGDLKYAKWTGTSWQVEVVDSVGRVGYYTSLALDDNWYPHIAYNDLTNTDLKYARWDGLTWHVETVDSPGITGDHASLVLDAFDRPHISYSSSTVLKYAKFNGVTWDFEIVDGYAWARWTSLALDSNGYPHIGYNDDTTSRKQTKLAEWDGSKWTIENLTKAGGFVSLKLDSGDYPRMAYYAWGGYMAYAYKAPSVPSVPQNLQANGENSQVGLTWNASETDGGYPITNYKIYKGTTSGGETFLADVGNVLTYTDAGLTNGQTYYYQVSAVNMLGESVLTAEVNATPMTISTEPRNLVTVAGNSIVQLSWDTPLYDGGSSITNYTVYRGTTSGGEVLLEQLGDVLSYDDTAVLNGITYYYQVTATNAAGEGTPSEEAYATPALAPNAPLGLTAIAGDSVINVTWVPPSFDGGSPITNYTIYKGTISGGQILLTTVSDVRYYLDQDVVIGVTYYYRVGAVNSMGEGPLSNEASATPVNQPPTCSVSNPLTGTKVSGDVEISGEASDPSGTVERVEVKIDDGGWITASGNTSWTYAWDTTTVGNGQHTINVRSFDGSDYSSEEMLTVRVDNQQESGFGDMTLWFVLVAIIIAAIVGIALMLRRRSGRDSGKEETAHDKDE